MKVNFVKDKKDKTIIEHGDLVRIGNQFYIVFEEGSMGYRLNNLSGVGYFGNYRKRENVISFLESAAKDFEILSKREYEIHITKTPEVTQ